MPEVTIGEFLSETFDPQALSGIERELKIARISLKELPAEVVRFIAELLQEIDGYQQCVEDLNNGCVRYEGEIAAKDAEIRRLKEGSSVDQ